MAEQYFAENPSAESAQRRITAELKGHRLSFLTDNATFSKEHLDEGSRILLESLPALHGRVADIGCGWGAIGCFAAALNPGAQIAMLDVNRRAVDLARRNIEANGLKNAEAFIGDGLKDLPEGLDDALLNPPIRAGKKVVYGLFAAAAQALGPGGMLYVVIRKSHGAQSAQEYLSTLFVSTERIAREKGFWVLCCKKGDRSGETVR